MGHRNSSTQFGGHGGFFAAGERIVAPAPASVFAADGNSHRHPVGGRRKSLGSYTLMFLVRSYVILLSPFFGGACKFEPSCSNYAYEAIARHGAKRGSLLAARRLLRCRPFTTGGFDPVPPADASTDVGRPDRRGPIQ